MKNKFTKSYFKKKFSAIPESQWTTGQLVKKSVVEGEPDCHCALGHCGMTEYIKPTEEALALVKLFGGEVKPDTYNKDKLDVDFNMVYNVNDALGKPKENILNFLKGL